MKDMPKLGFNIVNLIVPDEPVTLNIAGTNGIWELQQHPNYTQNRQAINSRVHAAVTHIIDHVDLGLAKDDEIVTELVNIYLAFSYISSNSVTMNQSTRYSRISFLQVEDGFPRDKGVSGIHPVVKNQADFVVAIDKMISKFESNKTDYHADLLIQFWLDILSCWSLENLFLSACTILEIIKQCERRRTGNAGLYFYDAIVSVSSHLGLSILNRDWINMRNDLIHEGHMSKVWFPGKSKSDCIEVCEDVMGWIDEFFHKIFDLGPVKEVRFDRGSLNQLNSYTTW